MKALSLWQPHAQAIQLGLKVYETRHWPTAYRGPLAIHAAQKIFRPQEYLMEYFTEACHRLKQAGCPHYDLDYGKVVCFVDLVDCVETESLRPPLASWGFWGDFGAGRYAFKLENLRVIPAHKRPAVKGRQGFFNVELPDEIWT
jgi:activating signal cointegrator 1